MTNDRNEDRVLPPMCVPCHSERATAREESGSHACWLRSSRSTRQPDSSVASDLLNDMGTHPGREASSSFRSFVIRYSSLIRHSNFVIRVSRRPPSPPPSPPGYRGRGNQNLRTAHETTFPPPHV